MWWRHELRSTFDLVGSFFPERYTHADRRYADLVRRYPDDQSLMLVAEHPNQMVKVLMTYLTE